MLSFKDIQDEVTVSVRSENLLLDISKCNLTNEACVDIMPTQYQVHFSKRSDGYIGMLVINSVKINETTFIFHNEEDTAIYDFEVYGELTCHNFYVSNIIIW